MAKNLLELANEIQYEKPTFDSNFYLHASEDGYKLNGAEARLGKGRMDDLIETYGVWNPKLDYAKGYLGFIDPEQFLTATTSKYIRERIEKESFPLDLEKLNNYPQTPFLNFKRDSKGNIYIVGHEGRHRMSALSKAGVKKIPIVFRDESDQYNRYNVQPTSIKGFVGGQTFDGTNKAGSINFDNLELIPLNYKNAPLLWEKFGYNK